MISDIKKEFLATDTRFHVVLATATVVPILQRISVVCVKDSVHAGADLVQLTSNIGVDGKVSHVVLRGANGAVYMDAIVPASSVSVEGEIFIPFDKLVAVVKQLTGEFVTISCVGFEVQISSENSLWRLKTPARAVIPERPEVTGPILRVDGPTLRAGLQSVIKAAATGLSRASLTQVRFHKDYVIACDGARLHRKQVPGLHVEEPFEISAPVVKIFLSAIKDVTDNVAMRVSGNAVALFSDYEVITSLRSQVPYPDVEKLFVSQAVMNSTSTQIIRTELLEAVKKVKNFADEVLSAVHIRSLEDNQIVIQAEDEVGNTAQSRIKVATQGKDVIDLKLNYKYLSDALDSMTSDVVILRTGKNSKTTKSSAFLEDTENGFQAVLGQVNIE